MNRFVSSFFTLLLVLAACGVAPLGAQEQAVPQGQTGAPEGEVQSQEEVQQPFQPLIVMPKSSEAGRYQLFEGQYSIAPVKAGDVPERQLFRIDTVTGEVWIGKQVQFTDRKSNRLVQQRYWEPFEQYLTAPAERPRP